MRRITIYLDEHLADELKQRAGGNVSAYVAALLEWDFLGQRFAEGLQKLRDLPGDPSEEPLTDVASILRAVDALRRPWVPTALDQEAGPAAPRSHTGGGA